MKSVQLLQLDRSYEWKFRGDVKHVNNLRFFGASPRKQKCRLRTRRGDRFVYDGGGRKKGFGALLVFVTSAFFRFFTFDLFGFTVWIWNAPIYFASLFIFFLDVENPAALRPCHSTTKSFNESYNSRQIEQFAIVYLNGLFDIIPMPANSTTID